MTKSHRYKVLRQLAREISIPLAIATSWAAFNYMSALKSLTDTITIFVGSFVSITYLTSQLYRVSKQLRTEDSLKSIDDRVAATIDQLEKTTSNLLSTMTGGNSFCYFWDNVIVNEDGLGDLTIVHYGDFPLFDVRFQMLDLDRVRTVQDRSPTNWTGINAAHLSKEIGTISKGAQFYIPKMVRMGDANTRSFSVQFFARNLNFSQILLFSRMPDDSWVSAIRVQCGSDIMLENIDPRFPAPVSRKDMWDLDMKFHPT